MQIKISRAQTGNCETDKDGDRVVWHNCGLSWVHTAAAAAHRLVDKPTLYKTAFKNVRAHLGHQKYGKIVLPTPEWEKNRLSFHFLANFERFHPSTQQLTHIYEYPS